MADHLMLRSNVTVISLLSSALLYTTMPCTTYSHALVISSGYIVSLIRTIINNMEQAVCTAEV